jgi:DNA-binding MarR family transcriptional regulator
LSEGDLVMELIETLEGLRRYKGWYRGHAWPVRKNAMVLLMFLHHHQCPKSLGLQPSELGDMLRLTRPTVTTLVNSLEEEGLVERINDDEDRRVVFVRPTNEGAALVQRMKEEFAARIREIMDYLGEKDGKELIRITRKVRAFLESQPDNTDGGGPSCGD